MTLCVVRFTTHRALLALAALSTSLVAESLNAQQRFGNQRGGQAATGLQSMSQMGQTGQLGQSGTGQLGGLGQAQGLGQGMGGQMGQGGLQNQQRGFVGRDAQDIRNGFGNMSDRDRRRATFNLLIDNLNEMRDDRRRRDRRRSQPPAARVQVTADIEVNAPSPIVAARAATTRASQALRQRQIEGASMSFEGGAIVLRGTVKSDYERALAEQLVSLEPGVSEIDNQLEIAP